MLKVRVVCPLCGLPMFAKSLEGHLEKVHELTGLVTLRLHPTNSYRHEPEVVELAPEEAEGGREEPPATATTPEPEAETEPKLEPEPAAETKPEKKSRKK